MRADPPTTKLVLHAGYEDPGGTAGWPVRRSPTPRSRRCSPLSTAASGSNLGLGGFQVLGRGAGAIQPGLASVVTYADGTSGHRRLGTDVPAPARRSSASGRTSGCWSTTGSRLRTSTQYGPWGATLGGGFAVARSGLGIDKYGNLLWAGSTYATPRAIAQALIQSGAVRAMQLDINPMWVGGFTFPNAATQQVVACPAQYNGIGTYLQPYGRDYFTVALR